MTGWMREKRYIDFSTDVPLMTRATRLVTGLISYYAVSLIFTDLVKEWIPGPGGPLAACFIQTFYITYIFPWLIKRCENACVPE